MTANPYFLPDDGIHRVVNFSGGRSSAYMLCHIVEAHGGKLPDYATVVFANTGKERNETLDFVQQVGSHQGVDIAWLEYRYRAEAKGGPSDLKNIHVVVGYNSASRNGEPFDQSIKYRQMLPTFWKRFCTTDLKVLPIKWYINREKKIPHYRTVLGLRFDEPKRWRKALFETCSSEYPLVHAEVTKDAVGRFWRSMPFDLNLEQWDGNCDLCFLKRREKKVLTLLRDPSVGDWWSAHEHRLRKQNASKLRKLATSQFRSEHTVDDLIHEARRTTENPLFDRVDEGGIDCFCTD